MPILDTNSGETATDKTSDPGYTLALAPPSLVRSFFVVSAAMAAGQCVIFTLYGYWFGFLASYALLFFPICIAFHAFLYSLLRIFKNDFRREPSGEILHSINLANIVTLTRLSTLPTLFFILHASKDYPIRTALLILLIPLFLSDFLDGYISRKGHQVTRAGKMMDSASDYALLFVIGLLFQYFHIIPTWFLILLIVRLSGQSIMAIFMLSTNRKMNPGSTVMGKIAIAGTMVLFTIEITRFFFDLPRIIYEVMEYSMGSFLLISLVEKIYVMFKTMRTPKPENEVPGRLHPYKRGGHHVDD